MIRLIKEIAAKFVLKKIFRQRKLSERQFNEFFQRSYSFLLVMPESETDFNNSFSILEYLDKNKKEIWILTFDYRVSKLPIKFKSRVIDHGVKDMNKFDLPAKSFISKINARSYDVILDLNREENIFYSILVCKAQSTAKVGFAKLGGDKYYNVIIKIDENNSENSYQNFLTCLRMF